MLRINVGFCTPVCIMWLYRSICNVNHATSKKKTCFHISTHTHTHTAQQHRNCCVKFLQYSVYFSFTEHWWCTVFFYKTSSNIFSSTHTGQSHCNKHFWFNEVHLTSALNHLCSAANRSWLSAQSLAQIAVVMTLIVSASVCTQAKIIISPGTQ